MAVRLAQAREGDLEDSLAAQRILSEFSSFAVKRRGNVVVMYAAFSPSDPRIWLFTGEREKPPVTGDVITLLSKF